MCENKKTCERVKRANVFFVTLSLLFKRVKRANMFCLLSIFLFTHHCFTSLVIIRFIYFHSLQCVSFTFTVLFFHVFLVLRSLFVHFPVFGEEISMKKAEKVMFFGPPSPRGYPLQDPGSRQHPFSCFFYTKIFGKMSILTPPQTPKKLSRPAQNPHFCFFYTKILGKNKTFGATPQRRRF